jgi:hypothetical protein
VPVYCPDGVRHEGGVTLIQALVRNVGTCVSMLREQLKWKPHQSLSTEARHRGGVARCSVEGSVMELERRWRHRPVLLEGQPTAGGAFE